MRKTIVNSTDIQLCQGPIRIKINQSINAISMSLSVDKFTSLRKASLLGQAKDAISATKEKQPPISPQKGIATKQLPHDQCDKMNT